MRNWKNSAKVRIGGALLTALTTSLFLSTTIAQPAEARIVTYNLDIPAQNLNDALQAFALASQHKLLYSSALVDGKRSPALKGQFTAEQAVKSLLSGTHLDYEVTSDGLVLIREEASPTGAASAVHSGGDRDLPRSSGSDQEGRKSSSGTIRLAQVDPGKNASFASVGEAGSAQDNSRSSTAGLDEIIVTAQKRSERLQDVPVPVTVLDAQALLDNNITSIRDYYSKVPGLNFAAESNGATLVTIRGIRTGEGGTPTIGVVFDDIPLGSATGTGGGTAITPDYDPGDLRSIEVLRGPQGTLYGSSAIGGLVKFDTAAPSTEKTFGHISAGADGVYSSNSAGYNVRGSVNIAVSDSFAIKASGFDRKEPGYIDNVQTGEKGINTNDSYGGRLVGLWKPSEDLSLTLSAIYENHHADAPDTVFKLPGLGELQTVGIVDPNAIFRKDQIYSATLNAKVAGLDVTSISAYQHSDSSTSVPSALDSPYYITDDFLLKKFSEEVRVGSHYGRLLDWRVGAFFTAEWPMWNEIADVIDQTSGAFQERIVDLDMAQRYQEYAGFGDVVLHATDQFDIQLGARYSYMKFHYHSVFATYDNATVDIKSNDDAFTYLVTPSYKLSQDLMVYARVASGYRAGAPNTVLFPGDAAVVPPSFKPDKTTNYELGLKGSTPGKFLSFDLSIYHIAWRDIQIASSLVSNGVGYGFTANAGNAKSDGVELSVDLHPFTNTTLSSWIAYDNAELTQNYPGSSPIPAYAGDRLPFSSRISGHVGLDHKFVFPNGMNLKAGIDCDYVGERFGSFEVSTVNRPVLPGYAKTDLHAGTDFGPWNLDLYANNVFDRRGVLQSDYSGAANYQIYIQPRLVGFTVGRSF
jgi:outer membrane receptor protein involved in Fe transport